MSNAKPAAAEPRRSDAMPPPERKPPVLVARDIVKELGQGAGLVRALKGVSVELYPGELTLLMGPSGSGKTTLLSILGCILTPTSGSLTLADQSTDGMSAEALADLRRRHVGFIFQGYNLFPTLSAEENVRLALDVRGERGADAIITAQRALHQVGLAHRMHAKPGQLSGGEKQRVAVARALASQPSLILADEPTAALDSANGQAVMSLLSEIAQGAEHAVLAVTHDPRTIPYADRILKIEDGVIVGEDRRPGSGHTVHALPPGSPGRDKKRKPHG
jgi:putative ABC transport system ATP-binding protein